MGTNVSRTWEMSQGFSETNMREVKDVISLKDQFGWSDHVAGGTASSLTEANDTVT